MGGLHPGAEVIVFGLTGVQVWVKIFATLLALLFILFNVRGSCETGLIGNIVTVFKVIVLGA